MDLAPKLFAKIVRVSDCGAVFGDAGGCFSALPRKAGCIIAGLLAPNATLDCFSAREKYVPAFALSAFGFSQIFRQLARVFVFTYQTFAVAMHRHLTEPNPKAFTNVGLHQSQPVKTPEAWLDH